MYREWQGYHNLQESLEDICDLDALSMITKESLVFGLCRFLTEVKKLDGGEFSGIPASITPVTPDLYSQDVCALKHSC